MPRSPSDRLDERAGRRAGAAGRKAAEVSIGPAGREAWKAPRMRRKESCRGVRRWSWPGGLEGAQDAPEGELPRSPSDRLDGRPGRRAGAAGRRAAEVSIAGAGREAWKAGGREEAARLESSWVRRVINTVVNTVTGRRGLHRTGWPGGLRGAQDALEGWPPRSSSPELAGRPERCPGCAGSPAAEVSIAGAGRKAWKAGRMRWKESCRGLHRRSWPEDLEGGQEPLEGWLPRCPSVELAGRPGRRARRAGRMAAEVSIAGAGRKAWKAGRMRRKDGRRGLHRRSWPEGLEGALRPVLSWSGHFFRGRLIWGA